MFFKKSQKSGILIVLSDCDEEARSTSDVITIDDRRDEHMKFLLGRMFIQQHKNYQLPRGGGFSLERERCCGVTSALAKCFYKDNFEHIKKPRGVQRSSKQSGIDFHRQIFHYYKCPPRECTMCLPRFGKKTKGVQKGSISSMRLKGFRDFLYDRQWFVLDCEVVVGIKQHNIATAIDVLCVDNLENPSAVFVVELKTGYNHKRHAARTSDKTGTMKGPAGKSIPNSYANQHQLQLWFGVEALWKTYNIRAAQGAVVYVDNKGNYSADEAKSWWFRNKQMQRKILKQLTGS